MESKIQRIKNILDEKNHQKYFRDLPSMRFKRQVKFAIISYDFSVPDCEGPFDLINLQE